MDKVTELKKLPLDFKEFEAGGKKYTRHTSVSWYRFNILEEKQIHLLEGVDVQTLMQKKVMLWEMLNKQQFADSAVILHNMMSSIERLLDPERIPIALQICALFINYEGEDLTRITEEQIAAKAKDWEGYDFNTFFLLAVSSVEGLLSAYKSNTPGTSEPK